MTWLEMAPVGDAWSAPRTPVRRFDKPYEFTLNLVFPSTTAVIEWGLGPVAQTVLGTDNAISTVERGVRAYVPVIFPDFTSSSILMLRNS